MDERLIIRVAAALDAGLTGPEIAEHFADEAEPGVVWLAYMAAKILTTTTIKEPPS
jgi:hypothetical protein